MVGIAQRRNTDGLAREIVDGVDVACRLRGRHQREQRQPAGGGEGADIGAVGVGLDRDIERGSGIIDGTADQRLHRGIAAAGIDEFDIEAVIFEMAPGAGDLIGNDAQQLAAESKPDLLALGLRAGRKRCRQQARDESRALEHRAPGHLDIGDASGSFVATAHRALRGSVAPRITIGLARRRAGARQCREP